MTSQVEAITRFITHSVWQQEDRTDNKSSSPALLHARLANRLIEMTERRKRLIKYKFKKEARLAQFEEQFPITVRRKEDFLQTFSSRQLEELLRSSAKSVSQEIVTCVIPKTGEGVLVTLESMHAGVLKTMVSLHSRLLQSVHPPEVDRVKSEIQKKVPENRVASKSLGLVRKSLENNKFQLRTAN